METATNHRSKEPRFNHEYQEWLAIRGILVPSKDCPCLVKYENRIRTSCKFSLALPQIGSLSSIILIWGRYNRRFLLQPQSFRKDEHFSPFYRHSQIIHPNQFWTRTYQLHLPNPNTKTKRCVTTHTRNTCYANIESSRWPYTARKSSGRPLYLAYWVRVQSLLSNTN